MFDFLANSVDGLILLSFIIALVVFFLYGPQKVYESLFGALLWLGIYLFLYQITYTTTDITRSLLFWSWILERRDFLLWIAHGLTLFLFFFAPISVGIHAGGMIRGSLWFLVKILVLSAFFVLFGVVLLSAASGRFSFMSQSPLFDQTFLQTSFFTWARLYTWIIERAYVIVLSWFLLAFYKILLSHWITKLTFFLGALYIKWDEIFGKKTFDQSPIPFVGDDGAGHDDHGAGDAHSWH